MRANSGRKTKSTVADRGGAMKQMIAVGRFGIFLACLLSPAAAFAQGSELVNGSTTSVTVQGLRVELTNVWPENPGYRPFRVRVTPVVPSTDDRELTIVIEATDYPAGTMSVQSVIAVPAGAAVARGTISVPMMPYARDYSVTLLEEGIVLKTQQPVMIPDTRGYRYWPGQTQPDRFPRILFAGDQLPDTGSLSKYLGAWTAGGMPSSGYFPGANPPSQPASGSIVAPQLPGAMVMPLDELPARWLDYTCLDVVCLSVDQLADLSARRPEVARALRDWTQAGGTLWVFGAGDAWEHLSKLDVLLGEPKVLPQDPPVGQPPQNVGQPPQNVGQPPSAVMPEPSQPGAATLHADSSQPGAATLQYGSTWAKPRITQFGRCPDWITWSPGGTPEVTVGEYTYDDKAVIDALWAWSRQKPTAPAERPFRTRDLGFGRVVALSAADPFPGDPWQWGWIFESMGSRRSWTSRHGCSGHEENPDFWNFLVPGVGLAPVTEFRILISLFVLVIGPVNYFLLRRWKRLHLLVLTIPAGAILVTGALFGYALIADGLGVKLRTRSLTLIDQRRGDEVCWARLSYYAGMAPSGGLTFSDETAVIPYAADPESAAGARRMAWDDGQRLTHGWLPARTPTQLFTIRSRATERGLKIEPATDATGGLNVINRLGAPVETLVIRDRDGDYFRATNLAEQGAGVAKTVPRADAMGLLRKILSDHQPSFAATGNRMTSGGMFGFGYNRYYRHGYGYGWSGSGPSHSLDTSLMESTLRTLLSSGDLKPGTYVAICSRRPDIEPGTPRVEEEDSFHVIIGEW